MTPCKACGKRPAFFSPTLTGPCDWCALCALRVQREGVQLALMEAA